MKPVKVNADAVILNGILKGKSGRVIAFNSLLDEVEIELDVYTAVLTSSDNIEQ